MLAQIIVTLTFTSSLNYHIQTESSKLVTDLTDIIQAKVEESFAKTLESDVKDLTSILSEAKTTLFLTTKFYKTGLHTASQSRQDSQLAVKETEDFCVSTLKDLPEYIFAFGITFEVGGFSKYDQYFMPYVYRDQDRIVYSPGVEIEGRAEEDLSDAEKRSYVETEVSRDYYTVAIPKDHDRSKPAPEVLSWTEPYQSTLAGKVLVSVATPVNEGGKAVGVSYVDLSLDSLTSILKNFAKISDKTLGLSFAWNSKVILSGLGFPDYEPTSVQDPNDALSSIIKTSNLSDIPSLGSQIENLAQDLSPGQIKISHFEYNNEEYSAIIYNESNLFGLAVLLPQKELMADTIKARGLMANLYASQERVLRNIQITAVVSLAIVLIILVLVIVFVRKATQSLIDLSWKLDSEANDIYELARVTSEIAENLDEDSKEQQNSLNRTSDAMKDIAEKIDSSNDSSKMCRNAMRETAQEVEDGGSSAQSMKKAMDNISETTNEIKKILNSMQGIAFQTNLLALNASVEAARAGESGQGFAVVAGEVRTLAIRSNEAAQKTDRLMEVATKGAEEGEKYAVTLNNGFDRIGESVSNVTKYVESISQASQEQKSSVDSVTGNLQELNRTVERNNTLAQKSLDNSTSLSETADDLTSSANELKNLILGKKR
jgi:methyl-accepting chemotaxis protein